ncbi:hypothetical protein DL96DRAFT_1562661 [Flagelloscypha sp. PMI_526]|nr:hypothetical protein DL96DRAFT_1562661 [Flagelloscypha sp. PMI_526]
MPSKPEKKPKQGSRSECFVQSQKRQNHLPENSLLYALQQSDLLDDQFDEDKTERGRALVHTDKAWQSEMAALFNVSPATKLESWCRQTPLKLFLIILDDIPVDRAAEIPSEDEYQG